MEWKQKSKSSLNTKMSYLFSANNISHMLPGLCYGYILVLSPAEKKRKKNKTTTIFKPHFPVWSWSFSIIALSFRGVDTEHSIDHFTRSDHKKSSLQWSFTFAPGMVSKLKKTRHIESWLSSSLLSPAEPIAISMQFVYNVGWSFHAAEIQLMPELQNDFWNKPADQCHPAYCFGFWLIIAIMCVHWAWDLTSTNHSFKCHCWSFSKTHGSSFCHLGLWWSE